MGRIIRDRRIVEDDWVAVADDAALPASGKVIVTHARWLADKAGLANRGGVGIRIAPALDVATLAPDLPALGLVALPFDFIQPRPEGGRTFDGRGYSQARQLRERLGYRGEIRAVGDIFRDAMFFAARCGVNAFELAPDRDLDDALQAFGDFSAHYQPAADDPKPHFRRT